MSGWYVVNDRPALSASENMAWDEHLFNLCHQQETGFLRFYAWERPSFSFGVSQKVHKALNLDYLAEHHYSHVRRITGGKTVLHDDEITYAVISSEKIFYGDNDLYRSYYLISRVLVEALVDLGIAAVLSRSRPSHLARTDNPCFSFPTPNEIEVEGRKLIGSAQKRDKTALLQHGSIPISMNYDRYAAGARSNSRLLRKHMITLGEIADFQRADYISAMTSHFQAFVGMPLKPFEPTSADHRAVSSLKAKYESEDWNFLL